MMSVNDYKHKIQKHIVLVSVFHKVEPEAEDLGSATVLQSRNPKEQNLTEARE